MPPLVRVLSPSVPNTVNRSSTTNTTPENKFIENGIQGQKNEGLELDDEHARNGEDIANREKEMVNNLDKYVSD